MHPALHRLAGSPAVRALVAWRLAVVVLMAAAMATIDLSHETVDLVLFVRAGRRLLSGDWADTFADPAVQAGPVFLALYGALSHVADLLGVSVKALASYVVQIGVALGAVGTLRRVRRAAGRPPSPGAEAAVGVLVVLWNLTSGAYSDGHPAQAAIPLLWLLAWTDQREGRPWRAALLVGLSAGWETWGILGLPVLLATPRLTTAVRSGALAVLTAGALFAPFAMFGDVRTGEYAWQVSPGAPLAPWLTVGADVGWSMRLLQGAAALLVGTAAAWALRRRAEAGWLVLVGILATRLLLDPVNYGYYWIAPQLVLVIAVGTLGRGTSRTTAYAMAGCYPLCAAGVLGELPTLALALVSVAAASLWCSTRADAARRAVPVADLPVPGGGLPTAC